MARTSRQAKIIEIINKFEIDTQDELVSALKDAGFKVTQATISRDIKDLGLFKVAGEQKKYKYAIVEGDSHGYAGKINTIFKESVLSVAAVCNQVVVRTLRGVANIIASVIDKQTITGVMGIVYGDDTVLLISADSKSAEGVMERVKEFMTTL